MSSDENLDLVFKALASRVRRSICDELKKRPLTTSQLCEGFPELGRCAVMQHLSVLEKAGLVVPVRKGRQRFNFLDVLPIQAIQERWIGPVAQLAASRLSELKRGLEQLETEPRHPVG